MCIINVGCLVSSMYMTLLVMTSGCLVSSMYMTLLVTSVSKPYRKHQSEPTSDAAARRRRKREAKAQAAKLSQPKKQRQGERESCQGPDLNGQAKAK